VIFNYKGKYYVANEFDKLYSENVAALFQENLYPVINCGFEFRYVVWILLIETIYKSLKRGYLGNFYG
jgi:hypothetical protein